MQPPSCLNPVSDEALETMSSTRESAPVQRNLARFFFMPRFQILQLPETEGRRVNSYWEHSQFFSSEYDCAIQWITSSFS